MKKVNFFTKTIYIIIFVCVVVSSFILNCIDINSGKLPPPSEFVTNMPSAIIFPTSEEIVTVTAVTTTAIMTTTMTSIFTSTTTYKTFGSNCDMTITGDMVYIYNNNNNGGAMNTTNTVDSDPLGVEQPIPENNGTVSPLCPEISYGTIHKFSRLIRT